jgi:iron(III) transport system ATP-binding protein
MAYLELRHLWKSFGSSGKAPSEHPVLRDISLSLPQGKVFSLLGPSGIGKTTLLKIICGLEEADSGEVLLEGRSLREVPVERRGVVLLFQEASLFPHLTVGENVVFGLRMRGVPEKERRRQGGEMLEMVGMESFASRSPRELSGGERQRVALARALVVRPRVLLLDEPFSSLDPQSRRSLGLFTLDLLKKREVTTLLVTHDWEEALSQGDYLGVLLREGLVQQGAPEEVFSSPLLPEVADFFGVRNYFDVTVSGGELFSPLGVAPSGLSSGTYRGMLRPDQMELGEDPRGEGVIRGRRYRGEKISYEVLFQGTLWHVDTPPEISLSPGERVWLRGDLSGIRAFPSVPPSLKAFLGKDD